MLKKGEERHRQISTNLLSGSKKILHNSFFSTNLLSGSKKILHNSFFSTSILKGLINSKRRKPDIKNFKRTRGCRQIQHINFQTLKRTRGCSHKYLRKLRNKCKTRTIFGQQTKEAHQHISFTSQHFEANVNNIFSTILHISYNTFISYKASRKRPQA